MENLLITKKWLKDNHIFNKNFYHPSYYTDDDFNSVKKVIKTQDYYNLPLSEFIKKLTEYGDDLDFADSILCHALSKKNHVKYAIYAAESVLGVYEKEYKDKIPRIAINEAKAWLKNPNQKFTPYNADKFYSDGIHNDITEEVSYALDAAIDIRYIINGKLKAEWWIDEMPDNLRKDWTVNNTASNASNAITNMANPEPISTNRSLNLQKKIIKFGLYLYEKQAALVNDLNYELAK